MPSFLGFAAQKTTMDVENINKDLKAAFLNILSINETEQEKAILAVYDPDCRLENSYLILQGREGVL